jgi:hypothetical protein
MIKKSNIRYDNYNSGIFFFSVKQKKSMCLLISCSTNVRIYFYYTTQEEINNVQLWCQTTTFNHNHTHTHRSIEQTREKKKVRFIELFFKDIYYEKKILFKRTTCIKTNKIYTSQWICCIFVEQKKKKITTVYPMDFLLY